MVFKTMLSLTIAYFVSLQDLPEYLWYLPDTQSLMFACTHYNMLKHQLRPSKSSPGPLSIGPELQNDKSQFCVAVCRIRS